jgi:2-methylcitrate dehydratase
LDSVACVIGGFDAPPSHIVRQLASKISASPGARVLGTGSLTAPDLAAFTNTVMLRVLDYNDTYVSRGSLHPSDLIPAALAAAEVMRSSGAEFVLSIVLGYEVAGAMSSAVNLRERGWDQGIYVAVATAVAVGKLLGLTQAQLGHAVSLALVPRIPLRQTRAGELSMWKGCATAASARGGVFAAQLAQLGMTGPDEPFEGNASPAGPRAHDPGANAGRPHWLHRHRDVLDGLQRDRLGAREVDAGNARDRRPQSAVPACQRAR